LNLNQVLLKYLLGIDINSSNSGSISVHDHCPHGNWHRLNSRSTLLK
jgi:hypothetical protein